MFSFFHRTPEIHVDCFTCNPDVYLNTPIVRAGKTFPDWYKELPKNKPQFILEENTGNHKLQDNQNLKNCQAVLEFYKRGIVLESWCDFYMKMDLENSTPHYWWSGKEQAISFHRREQIGNGFLNHHHMKLVSPWFLEEKTGAKFMWVGAEWALDKFNFKILPAVVSYDTQVVTNVNIMYPYETKEFMITIGTPLVHIIPLSEKKLKFKNHLITELDMRKKEMRSSKISFYGWKSVVKLRERNKKRGTCPFGFGDNNE
jgi:hypothetical protein